MSNAALRTWVTPSCKIRFLPRDTFKFLFKFQKKQLKEEHTHTKAGHSRRATASLVGGTSPKCPNAGAPSPTMGNHTGLSLTKVIGLRVSIHLTLQTLGEGF